MIKIITGTVHEILPNSIILLTNSGVGYEVFATASTIGTMNRGEGAIVHTHMVVRETLMQLFGFLSSMELEVFEKLISVSGVGPKGALAILNLGPVDRLLSALAGQDDTYVAMASGIGKKTSQKIVIELKDKFDAIAITSSGATPSATQSDLRLALEGLGYRDAQIRVVLEEIDDTLAEGEQLRQALQILSR